MKNLRTYGSPPFSVVLVHGGPGGPGEMAPIARKLEQHGYGVLEPLQTKDSLQEQVTELKDVLVEHANLPVTLIGHSWGAMLSFILAAKHPELIKKLLLVASSMFKAKDAQNISKTRLARLCEEQRNHSKYLFSIIDKADNPDELFREIYNISYQADIYDPLPASCELLACQYHIFKSVWHDAEVLRESGELLALGKQIKCKVVAIHGDYDAHPATLIKASLNSVINNFAFVLLKNCGHYPWKERQACDAFYKVLFKELG